MNMRLAKKAFPGLKASLDAFLLTDAFQPASFVFFHEVKLKLLWLVLAFPFFIPAWLTLLGMAKKVIAWARR